MNVIIRKDSLQVVGFDRPPLPNEFEIKDVDVSSLSKPLEWTDPEAKVDEEGKELFLLPQPDLEENDPISRDVETTEETDRSVMILVRKPVPLMRDGEQVTYQRMARGEVTENTGEPVMEEIPQEEGDPILVQKKNEEDQPLFWGLVPVGDPEPCFTWEEVEEQKKDAAGNLMFYKKVTEDNKVVIPQPPLEVTKDHPEWTEDLEKIMIEVPKSRTVSILEEPDHFTYYDVKLMKDKQDRAKEQLEQAKDVFLNDIGESAVTTMINVDALGETMVEILMRLEALENA